MVSYGCSPSTPLDHILDLLSIPGTAPGYVSANDRLFELIRDRIIENLMGGVGFASPDWFLDGCDWGVEWAKAHPEEWARYQQGTGNVSDLTADARDEKEPGSCSRHVEVEDAGGGNVNVVGRLPSPR